MIHVVDDPRYRTHRGPSGHPERPERLVAVGEALAAFEPQLVRVEPRPATDEELLLIHEASLVRELAHICQSQAPAQLDPDTYVCAESETVARLAAGAAIELALRVGRGDARHALAAVRPPGHHAEAARAMGFCLFNNAAIATRALQTELGVGRVMLIDFDVHHGNGTQHSFEEDPSVLYVSTHQFPFYPGTGAFGERGRGRGEGATFNVPMPAGCGDDEYVGVMQRLIVPAALAFRPEAIVVSAGFDAHRDDPLAAMELSGRGYAAMVSLLRALADELCGGRLLFVLEGGYAASGLRDGVTAMLGSLCSDTNTRPAAVDAPAGSMLRALCDGVVAVHGSRIPGLGAA